jgi:hypothetical protein
MPAVTDKVDELVATLPAEIEIPVGADPTTVPPTVVYQTIVKAVPSVIFVVVAVYVGVEATPAWTLALMVPTEIVGAAATVNVITADDAPPPESLKK